MLDKLKSENDILYCNFIIKPVLCQRNLTHAPINQVANQGLSILLELKFNEVYNRDNLILELQKNGREQMKQGITAYLNDDGVLIQWPAKYHKKRDVIAYLASKFDSDKTYDEQDANLVLRRWSDYADYPLLRRALVDFGLLTRDVYGRTYQLSSEVNSLEN